MFDIILNSWKLHIARCWAMCKKPDIYVDKKRIFDYQKEIYRRSLLSIKDVGSLSQPIADDMVGALSIGSSEALFYGAMHALWNYSGLTSFSMPPEKIGVQHGYVFEIRNWEKIKMERRNLVWSKRIVEMYREYTSNKDIYAIGAPFFYSKPLLNKEQLKEEKEQLGKTLLAFPMHSQSHVDTNYDPKKFLDILIDERKRFDSVLVCMYWKDILRGSHKVFQDMGFQCVCNGHLFDPFFLPRQKTLFELADATISNGVGSHIGYSIFMGKPHWLIDDEYVYVNSRKGGDAKDLTEVSKNSTFLKVKEAFLNNSNYEINQLQRSVIDEFWGLSDMKSPDEIKKLLLYLYNL